MIVRIRMKNGPVPRLRTQPAPRPNPLEVLSGVSSLLQPVSAALFALSLWRLGADLGLAGTFMFKDGVLSHWQLWFAGAAAVLATAWLLGRRAGGNGDKRYPA